MHTTAIEPKSFLAYRIMNQLSNNPVIFSKPKKGETENTIEDACASSSHGVRIAICDGMSSTLNARRWAKWMAEYFIEDQPYKITKFIYQYHKEWLRVPQKNWKEYYKKILEQPSNKTTNKINFGKGSNGRRDAGATFLGIEFYPIDPDTSIGCWSAVALGDSCLFQFTKENCSDYKLVKSFPLENSDKFTSLTIGFFSLSDKNSNQPEYYEGNYSLGDIFILATDALSEWILKEIEVGNDEWRKLFAIETDHDFRCLLDRLRQEGKIKDDDTTLCRFIAEQEMQRHLEFKDEYTIDSCKKQEPQEDLTENRTPIDAVEKSLSPQVQQPLNSSSGKIPQVNVTDLAKGKEGRLLPLDVEDPDLKAGASSLPSFPMPSLVSILLKPLRCIPYQIKSFIIIGILLIITIELLPQFIFYWVTFVSKVTIRKSYPYFHSIEIEFQHKKSR